MDKLSMKTLLLSVPVVFGIFFIFLIGLYLFLSAQAPRGEDHPEKYQPYSGGQVPLSNNNSLTYQAFFRIGLLFAILHVAALILSTLPLAAGFQPMGLFFLIGISISTFVLAIFYARK